MVEALLPILNIWSKIATLILFLYLPHIAVFLDYTYYTLARDKNVQSALAEMVY